MPSPTSSILNSYLVWVGVAGYFAECGLPTPWMEKEVIEEQLKKKATRPLKLEKTSSSGYELYEIGCDSL
jgi:hypothetical protein